MSKKGQSAIEYLQTYGWALMVLAVTLAVLYIYFDYKPDTVIPDSCDFGDSFDCIDAQVFKNGTVLLSLKNTVGLDILVNSTICQHQTSRVFTSESLNVPAGGKFMLSCDTGVTFEKKAKVDFTIVYIKSGFSFPSSSDALVVANPMDS